MKALIIIFLLIGNLGFSQNYRINITTDTKEEFKVYIDNQLQFDDFGTHFLINFVPKTKKTLTIELPAAKLHTTIGTSGRNIESYKIVKTNGAFSIKTLDSSFKFKKDIQPFLVAYKKIQPKILPDSTTMKYTCKLNDSMINQMVIDLGLLKKEKPKITYLDNMLKNKCLKMNQIRSLAYRLPSDNLKFDFFKKYYNFCVDKNKYIELSKTFEGQEAYNNFEEWVNNLNQK